MTDELRERFDGLLEDALETMPAHFRRVIEEVPVIVVDRPDAKLLDELRREGVIGPDEGTGPDDSPMGLHSGVAITEASVERSGELPGQIHVFREPIVAFAGGWEQPHADEEIYEEIRVTLLHEIGHHFGLDEDDLEGLGFA